MERMKHMKETLMSCVQGQLGDLASVDAEELGAAVDMIKDLSEAIYYCTIVKSMEEEEKKGKQQPQQQQQQQPQIMYYPMPMYNYRDMDRDMGRMYYDASERGNNARGGGTRGYNEYNYAQGGGGGNSGGGQGGGQGGGGSRNFSEYNYAQGGGQGGGNSGGGGSRNYPIELRDYREGQSPLTRKTYMERKMHGGDKATQMQELEKYMHELTRDLTEMVEGSSPEEKQMLQKKLSTLATKIV